MKFSQNGSRMLVEGELFTLKRGSWYALERYEPHDASFSPYCTPVRVDAVVPLHTGGHQLQLELFKANYPAGVQSFRVTLTVLRRTPALMVASEDSRGRIYLFGAISREWVHRNFPVDADAMARHPEGIAGWLRDTFGCGPA